MDKSNYREIMQKIYKILQKRGYSPINQIVGFLLTEDPTYITNQDGARNMASRIDRDELLKDIVAEYYQATQRK